MCFTEKNEKLKNDFYFYFIEKTYVVALLSTVCGFVDKEMLTCKRIKTKNRWSPIHSVVLVLCSKMHSCEN